jgi:hypothetical protein
MSPSIITNYDCEAIQAAMGVALLKLNNAHPELTYTKIGKVIEREKQSVWAYINGGAEMPASCWLKAVAEWPELEDRLLYELDEAEKAFRARQRELRLELPNDRQEIAA